MQQLPARHPSQIRCALCGERVSQRCAALALLHVLLKGCALYISELASKAAIDLQL
jgi:hypothetical protein